MDADFWHDKWQIKDIGFHQAQVNPLLVKYFAALFLQKGSRVFVPLCGKTLDIAWLLAQGYSVVGAELSEVAVKELFIELGIDAKVTDEGQLKHYSGEGINIFVGDIFYLSNKDVGQVDATYDRAALVALPKDIRQQYTQHLIEITHQAPQLIICFEYNQKLMAGPPFSITQKEMNQHYKSTYHLQLLESADVVGRLKGVCPAKENIWLLANKS